MKINKVGQKHTTKQGCMFEVIEYFSYSNCTIKFSNGFIIKNVAYHHIKNGNIKNPFYKSVIGFGFIGAGKYSYKTHPRAYKTWYNMILRCYDEKVQEKYPTYKDVTIYKEWECFQNFAEWFENNYKEDFVLDKDILFKGNKIYSSETCCFVPKEINGLFVKSKFTRGNYPIGVRKVGSKFEARLSINNTTTCLGLFSIVEHAFFAYKTTKEKYIKKLAEKYKNKITEPTYRALINYKVEIID